MGETSNDKSPVLGAGQRLNHYGTIQYIKYDFGSPADEAKKQLEFGLVEQALHVNGIRHGDVLDIGCATGRWPIWFSQLGFRSTGYDISVDAIRFCKKKSKTLGLDNVNFVQRDILSDEEPIGSFDVVTA